MKKLKIRNWLLVVFVFGFLVLPGAPVLAREGCKQQCPPVTNKSAFLPDCSYHEGNRAPWGKDPTGKVLTVEQCCGCRNINVFVQLLVKGANWFMGFVGAIALVMFVYGGFTMLTSAGSSEKVDLGKKALVAAVVGLAIIFSAQLLMRFVLEQTIPKEKLGVNLEIKPTVPVQSTPAVTP